MRVVLDQHRADRRAGLTTGTMISGYQGSPLGGFDQELARNRELLDEHHVLMAIAYCVGTLAAALAAVLVVDRLTTLADRNDAERSGWDE